MEVKSIMTGSPKRRIFTVDVGDMSTQEIKKYFKEIKKTLRNKS